MCGIVGCLAYRSSKFKVTEEYIISARDTMVKRGPDGGDLWTSSVKIRIAINLYICFLIIFSHED